MEQDIRAVSAGQAVKLENLWRRMVRLDKDYHDTNLGPRQIVGKGAPKTPSVHDFVQAATNPEAAMHRRAEYSKAKIALDNIREAYNVKVLQESRGKGQVPGVDRWEQTRANIRTEYANDPRRAEAAVEKLDRCLNDVRDAILEAGEAMTRDAEYKLPSSRLLNPDAEDYVPWTYVAFED
ncbi:hypothetical protein LIA77_11690 [Sarocladium implicatum]|nr:hypothetical protein LIA77_11690 [Sarocladium implicatum]